jgi:hypothetical protein
LVPTLMVISWFWREQRPPGGSGRRLQLAALSLPVRLHRWLARVRPGGNTLHSCDNPCCIKRAHVTAGGRSQNVADSWRRLRRVARPPSFPIQPPRAQPPPPMPSHDARIAAREAVFVMTGFGSPSKLARTQLRKRQGESCPPARLGAHLAASFLVAFACLGGVQRSN